MSEIKVLIIDDDPKIRQTVSDMLNPFGYKVFTASDGEDGLKQVPIVRPDIIICDIEMPVMDGITFLQYFRSVSVYDKIPVLILTGVLEQFYDALVNGADLYLLKPFLNMKRLSSKIEQIMELHAMSYSFEELHDNVPDIEIDELVSIARTRVFAGNLKISHANQDADFEFRNGKIISVISGNKKGDSALEMLLEWIPGTYSFKFKSYHEEVKIVKGDIMEKPDLSKAVQIAKDTWWVGYRNPNSLLQMNVYLRVFKSEKGRINYVIDPGAPVDFPEVSQKIGSIIGDISKVGVVSLNHQDPDVCMNTIYIKAANPKLLYIATEDTWRLIVHYDLDPKNIRMVTKFKDFELNLSTGHKLKYILSPYCHFRGAFLTYDPETQILFTGDLFAGLSMSDRINNLWADEKSWDGMAMFHRIYMPSNKAIKLVIKEIRKLLPNIKMIAPQHGDIIPESQIANFLAKFEQLEVGVDLLKEEDTKEDQKAYLDAINEILENSSKKISPELIFKRIESDSSLTAGLEITGRKITRFKGDPLVLIARLITQILQGETSESANFVKSIVIKSLVMRRLPAVTINWEGDEMETVIDQSV